MLDRPTECRTELVALQGLNACGKKAFCVESIVSQEFPQRAMNGICATARNNVRRRTRAVPKFGVGRVRQDAKLGDGVNRGFQDESAIHSVEIVRAID